MDELPEDLAKPKSDWPIADVMGIVIGGALLLIVVGMLIYVTVT